MPAPSFDMCCHVEKLSQDVLELEPRQDVRSEQLMKLDMKQRYVDDGQEREARGRCLRGISTCHRELFPKVKKTGEAVKRDKLGRAGAGDDDEAASVGRWWDLAPLDGHQPATCRSWTLTVPPRPMHADADAVVPLGSACGGLVKLFFFFHHTSSL
jgi:hypothetical protein